MTVVAVTLSWAFLLDALGLNFFVDKLPDHDKVSFIEGDTGRHSPASIKEHLKISFFLSGFSFTDTDDSQDSRGRERTIFYSTLPLPPAHEHSDIYLQLCM